MKPLALFAVLLVFTGLPPLLANEAESQIRTVLNSEVDAWNRGDVLAFVSTYAEDCIFVGKQVLRGRSQLLARYKRTYPTREAMGNLKFSSFEVHVLTDDVATVTGKWRVTRSGSAGKDIGGLFSLVFHREAKEWKIALDHTS